MSSIKQLKRCILQFLNEKPAKITDNSTNLIILEQCLEDILWQGLKVQQNSRFFHRIIEPFSWLQAIKQETCFSFRNCVELTCNNEELKTNKLKLRWLIKICLNNKCLHVPFQTLINLNLTERFYELNSILGDEILQEILLSTIKQLSEFNFDLDLKNNSFLDQTWAVPDLINLELVPCKSLGLTIGFVQEKGVIVQIQSGGIAEDSNISSGDVLYKINTKRIYKASEGRRLLNNNKGPVNLTIIKALSVQEKKVFEPVKALWKELNFNCDSEQSNIKKCDFEVVFAGRVAVGDQGSAKIIPEALKALQNNNKNNNSIQVIETKKQKVIIESNDLGVQVRSLDENQIILEHSFMKISACSGVSLTHFAYVAGESNCDLAKEFVCYVFEVPEPRVAEMLLQIIGFKRFI